VPVLVNKAGPYANPSETYNYARLPFCRPRPEERPRREWGGLGEVLLGNQLEDSQLDDAVRFGVPAEAARVCSQTLSEEDAAGFRRLVQQQYWYEWFVDGLPVWGFVGEMRPPPDEAGAEGAGGGQGAGMAVAHGDGGGAGGAAAARNKLTRGGAKASASDLLLEPRAHGPPMQVWVYTHRQLDVATNGHHIVHVNMTSTNARLAEAGADLSFTLGVSWAQTHVPFSERFERYLDAGFFEHRVHWFAVANSFLMVLFLVAVVSAILARALRADLLAGRGAAAARSGGGAGNGGGSGADLEALERDLAEETGWKLLSGDVFRAPPRLDLLCACTGTGAQLAAMAAAGTAAALLGALHEDRGAVLTALLASYALASLLGGYVSGAMYARRGGQRWPRAMLLTVSLFPALVAGAGALLNAVAVAYGSLAATPATTAVAVLALWALLAVPLGAVGTLLGRARAAAAAAAAGGGGAGGGGKGAGGGAGGGGPGGAAGGGVPAAPCRVKRIPTPIPPRPWYASRAALALAAGALPFASIFTELFFVYASLHGFRVYYVFGFLALAELCFCLVAALMAVVSTFALLQREDWRWPWAAFGSGASAGAYVAVYLAYYFARHTRMHGALQVAFFFGYGLVTAAGIALLAGSVAYGAAAWFVWTIYSQAKND